jgi:hypothetical protein
MKYSFLSRIIFLGIAVCLLREAYPLQAAQEPQDLASFCGESYQNTQNCPTSLCDLTCQALKEGEPCKNICLPKPCTKIDVKDCPEQFCAVMTDCSNKEICHFKMAGGAPKCGDIAYAGQDVECCPGLVRRCGVEFIDGNCDMEGKNSIYNLPICLPCGNGICNQFENRCNCPEDCGKAPDIPLIPNL